MNAENSDTIKDGIVKKLMKQTANEELGITNEYNKKNRDKLWDSTKEKKEYKEKVFSEKETYVDPISGKILHKSQKAAQKKYHMKNASGENTSHAWAGHSAETDHINALKDLHDTYKNNPFLRDSDLKEIANSEANYRILSKQDNTSKGDKSDWEVIRDKDSTMTNEAKLELAKQKVRADIIVHSKFGARTIENMGNEFVVGAKDTLIASVFPLTEEAVSKMMDVAKGEKSIQEASSELRKTTVEVAVAGGTNKLLIDTVTQQFANSNSPLLKDLVANNKIGQIIAIANIVQESAVKYVNGEISGQEFIEEVGVRGTKMIGSILGTMALPGIGTAGGILGTIITTVACSAVLTVFNTEKHMKDYKITEQQIRKLESDALREMEKQRVKFRSIVEREFGEWDITVEEGFNQIMACACETTFSLNGVTEGLDKVLSVFGCKVRFSSLEEYEAQLDETLVLKF